MMTRDYAAPDWRGLCLRMADELDHHRQLLTDDRREVHPLAVEARAALARWARPAPAPSGERQVAPVPVAVSERLPGVEDCDAEGRCWYFQPGREVEDERWELMHRLAAPSHSDLEGWEPNWSHWLPAHALPLPSGEVE